MHIIIPMSGIGKRFLDAGYQAPKFMIEIDGKPVIQHVVDLFPGEKKMTFICNAAHLEDTSIVSTLKNLAPQANIVSIAPHKLGPVYAVSQVFDTIDDNEEVIVNYCDFGTYWNYSDFLQHTRNRGADGAIPAYKGFHPHMMGSTNYAFMRDDSQWMLEIKEKEPFTNHRMQEFASNGTYYFRLGKFVKKYFQQLMDKKIALNDEFYVSLIYNLLVDDGLKVSIYEVQHMLQWGTPQDVDEYLRWSRYFKQILSGKPQWKPEPKSITLIPLAGLGSRFAKEGYDTPKPLIDVAGYPMIRQANYYLPKSENNHYVVLKTHCDQFPLLESLKDYQPDCKIIALEALTSGQAVTCAAGLESADDEAPLLIGACDNGMLWNAEYYQHLINDSSIDAIAWSFRNHPSANAHPQMYGWIETEIRNTDYGECVFAKGVSVKAPISNTPEKDHAIVGTFYFRHVALFKQALDRLIQDDIRVNGEFYVDSVMDVLVAMGKTVAVFEVDHYVGWGTPNEYKTYRYWQSYFHKSPNHPYVICDDPTLNPAQGDELVKKSQAFSQSFR